MKRVILLAVAAAGAFAGCAQALAAATAQANVSLDVQQAASVNIVTPLVLPTVSTTAVVPSSSFTTTTVTAPVVASSSVSGGGAPTSSGLTPTGNGLTPAGNGLTTTNSAAAGASPLGNATLTIYGQSGSAVSMAVPETFKVIRTGGTESLTVKTNTNSPYSLAGNGVVLGGGPGSESMSVNVGGALALASADQLIPGPYEGLLVVVVQYN